MITWNNDSIPGLLELSLSRFDITPIVLGSGVENWQNPIKLDLTIEYLKNSKTKYTLGIDSTDVNVLDNPNLILDKFL